MNVGADCGYGEDGGALYTQSYTKEDGKYSAFCGICMHSFYASSMLQIYHLIGAGTIYFALALYKSKGLSHAANVWGAESSSV